MITESPTAGLGTYTIIYNVVMMVTLVFIWYNIFKNLAAMDIQLKETLDLKEELEKQRENVLDHLNEVVKLRDELKARLEEQEKD